MHLGFGASEHNRIDISPFRKRIRNRSNAVHPRTDDGTCGANASRIRLGFRYIIRVRRGPPGYRGDSIFAIDASLAHSIQGDAQLKDRGPS